MSLYTRTIDVLRLQEAEEALRHKREDRARKNADATMLVTQVGTLVTADEKTLAALRAALTVTDAGDATLTIDDEFTFTLRARQQCDVLMLPSICTAGCQAMIADRDAFLAFVQQHLALDHTPPVPTRARRVKKKEGS